MKRVFVAERNGKPIEINNIHIETMSTLEMANARIEVTPLVRLKTERVVPYVSVEEVQELLDKGGNLSVYLKKTWKGLKTP